MAYNAGSAFIQIVPSFRDFVDNCDKESAKAGESAGKVFGDSWARMVASATRSANVGPDAAEAAKQGSTSAGKFADGFKARLEAAIRSLPDITLDADSTPADRKIVEIRGELEALSAKRIGVDLSDREALAKISALKADLDVLGAKSPSIRVKVDTAFAAGKLAAIGAEADLASGVTSGGRSGIAGLASSLGTLGDAIGTVAPVGLGVLATGLIPLAGLALGGLATLPAVLGGIGTGAAAIALALKPLGKAVHDTFDPIVKALQPVVAAAILPGFTAGLKDMKPALEAVQPWIVLAARGIGSLAQNLGTFLGSKEGVADLNSILGAGAGFMKVMGDAGLTLFKTMGKIGSQAAPLLGPIGDGITHLVNAFSHWVDGGGFENFVKWLQKNGPGIVKSVEQLLSAAGKIAVALAPLGVIVLEALAPLAQFVENSVELTAKLIGWAQQWRTAWDGAKTDAETAYRFLDSNVLGPLSRFFESTLPSVASRALDDFTNAISSGFDAVVRFFESLPGRAVGAISRLPTMLGEQAGLEIGAFAGALVGGAVAVFDFWTTLAPKTLALIAALPGQLYSLAGNAMSSMASGLIAAAPAVWGFVASIPPRILGLLGNTAGLLVGAGLSIMGGLGSGVGAGWAGVAGFFVGLPGRFGGMFAGAVGWLFGAGEQIMHGLLNGIKAGFGGVASFVGGIAGWVASHKGPPSYDAVLLAPHGRLIMQGLLSGIRSAMPSLEATLADVTGMLAGAGLPALAGATAGSGPVSVPQAAGLLSRRQAAMIPAVAPFPRSDLSAAVASVSASRGDMVFVLDSHEFARIAGPPIWAAGPVKIRQGGVVRTRNQ